MSEAPVAQLTGAEEVRWDLSDLYAGADDPALDRNLDEADARAEKLGEQYRGKVASLSAAELLEVIREYEEITETAHRIGAFAYMLWTTNTEDPAAGALLAKATERTSRLSQKLVFFELEWANTPDDKASALMNDPALAHYRHWLEASRRYRPHLLSEPEEKILAEKAITGREAWSRFFGEVHGAARYELDGETVPEEVVLTKLYSPDRAVRQRAAESLTVGLKGLSRTTTFIYNTVLSDKASDDTLRKYPKWISSRNLANEISDEMVEALIQSVTSHYGLVARYYNLKKKLLGLDELFDYDRYAPLPVVEERQYTWDQARDIVLSGYGEFHPRLREVAGMFFEKHWIDAAMKPGKRAGAYCYGITSAHPYVFMNYESTPRNVETLAHELGHGVHDSLSQKLGTLQAHPSLALAETASVFGEMIVFQNLLAREEDPNARLAMLASKIEMEFATTFRQVSMNRFEDVAHTARRSEGELATDRLNETWLQTQRDMFGDSVTMTDNYGIWWSYVPHFIDTPGYVYAYAFGNLLVLALYGRYQEVGPGFADGYIEMLSMGSSKWPNEIVKPLGIDLTDPGFWDHGLKLLEGMVKQAEELAESVG